MLHSLQGEGDNHTYPSHHERVTHKNTTWREVQVKCVEVLFWSLKGSLHVFERELQKYGKSGFFRFFVPKHYVTDAMCSSQIAKLNTYHL